MVKVRSVQPKAVKEKTKEKKTESDTPKGSSGRSRKEVAPTIQAAEGKLDTMSENAGNEDPDNCGDCGKAVLATQRGLKCDNCGYWHHASCEKVNDEIYNFLNLHEDEQSIMWCCRKCIATNTKLINMITTLHGHQQKLETRINDLSEAMTNKLEELSAVLITRMGEQEQPVKQDIQIRMEEKVDKLMEKLDSQKLDDEPKQIKGCIQKCVTTILREDKEEEEEKQRRKANVVIHGLVESSDEDVENRKKDDSNMLAVLFHDLKVSEVKANSIIRLGKKPANETERPRSIKVILQNEDQCNTLLK